MAKLKARRIRRRVKARRVQNIPPGSKIRARRIKRKVTAKRKKKK